MGWKARRSCDKSNVTMPPCPSYLSMWQNHYTCFFHEYPPRGMFQAVGIRGYGARDSPVALAQKGSVSKRGPTQFSSIICTVYIYIYILYTYLYTYVLLMNAYGLKTPSGRAVLSSQPSASRANNCAHNQDVHFGIARRLDN